MTKLFTIFIILLFALGCGSSDKIYNYKSYPFDKQVIAKLPLYDSISLLLLQNFAALKDEMKEHASFDYSRSNAASLLNPVLPTDVGEKINTYMDAIGVDNITEFSVYKDSSIKYTIRDTDLIGYGVTARERLSYLPNGGNMQRREAPDKDTVLSNKWQYWIRFDEKYIF